MYSQVIYHYPLSVGQVEQIYLPTDTEIVHFGLRGFSSTVWARHSNPDDKPQTEAFSFVVHHTGKISNLYREFVHKGTYQDSGYVWHLLVKYPANFTMKDVT